MTAEEFLILSSKECPIDKNSKRMCPKQENQNLKNIENKTGLPRLDSNIIKKYIYANPAKLSLLGTG